ncbi:MAG: hypothetical protein AVDCRST_MAG49-3380, partial [uncultured Thermomicrobiales bacterium]
GFVPRRIHRRGAAPAGDGRPPALGADSTRRGRESSPGQPARAARPRRSRRGGNGGGGRASSRVHSRCLAESGHSL